MFSTRIRRAIACFLLLNFVTSVVAPTVTFALTAGPTAPEATTFEPVDTTDMVDLKTGDFTYTLPLLEVPGVGGSYPLALSYHAGIQPGQEASWTGLGFNVNPGAITRLVNGYADDHFDVKNNDRVFWEGGSTTVGTVGLSYGFANGMTVSAELEYSNDTYKGKGVGGSTGVSVGFGGGPITANINARVGITPYGSKYFSAGYGVGIGVANAGVHASAQYNSLTGTVDGGAFVGVSQYESSMGVSISSDGAKATMTNAGITAGVHNSKRGNVSTDGDDFKIEIPIWMYFNLSLGRSYTRYWIDETEGVATFGSLYSNFVGSSKEIAYDNHELLDIELDHSKFSDPEKQLGGTVPDYDLYSISGQGIGGSIRPYHFQQQLFRQNKAQGEVTHAANIRLSETPSPKPYFRFINDFSNRYEDELSEVQYQNETLSHEFDGDPDTGMSGDEGFTNNRLAASKHVEYFTNREIQQRPSARDPYKLGFLNAVNYNNRPDNPQVGAFVVTKSDGITYHYALPVYSFDESIKNTRLDEEEGLYYNTLSKPEPYAYEWLLTAVTGPDFVDRNNNGLADQGDWGYWVSFEYDKWLNDYRWRNPGEGTHKDIDGEFEFYSSGKKEIYYVSRIVTDTHVAIFSKSERIDGREVMSSAAGGFEAIPIIEVDNECVENCQRDCTSLDCVDQCQTNCQEIVGYNTPRPMLKLDAIKLLRYEDYASGRTGDEFALRKVEFEYDYSLATNTPNSFSNEVPNFKQGKLTLKEVEFKGKKAAGLMPPVKFYYDNNPAYCTSAQGCADAKDAKDMWGYHKSDYQKLETSNLAHLTTIESAKHTDAWSLNRIVTSLGAEVKIEYESDTYRRPVLYQSMLSTIGSLAANPTDKMLTLGFTDANIDLTKIQELLTSATFKLLYKFGSYRTIEKPLTTENIEEVTANTIKLKGLYDEFFPNAGTEPVIELVTGHLFLSGDIELPGGGLRVKNLEYADSEMQTGSTTTYEYQNGTTSYEPVKLDRVAFNFGVEDLNGEMKDLKKAYLQDVRTGFSKILFLSRYVPSPGVMYEYVTVREKSKQYGVETELPNYSTYQFEVFKENMLEYKFHPVQDKGTVKLLNLREIMDGVLKTISDIFYDPDDLDFRARILTRRVDFNDYTSRIGNLKRVTLFANNGTPVAKTEYFFLYEHPAENENTAQKDALKMQFNNQGVIHESFSRAKMVLYVNEDTPYGYTSGNNFGFPFQVLNDYEYHKLALVLKWVTYPSVQTAEVHTNFKTGIVTRNETIGFDFYSGEPIRVVTSDSYGNRFMSETTPAYSLKDEHGQPVYPAMGLKSENLANKHMLTQTAMSANYKVSSENVKQGLMSASVQTWSDQVRVLGQTNPQSGMMRKDAAYRWNGQQPLESDGVYPLADFNSHPFNFSNPAQSSSWEKAGSTTLYDVYSQALEVTDINGNHAAAKLTNNHERVLASASNAGFYEFASSGAEYLEGNTDDEGGVDRGEGNPSTSHAHTGKYGLLVGFNSSGFNTTLTSDKADLTRNYRASVWVYAPGEAETASGLQQIQLFYKVNGVEKTFAHPILQKNKSKSWYLLNLNVILSNTSAQEVYVGVRNNSSRGVYFDDFRVNPVDGSVTSYVYDQRTGEVTHILDPNNFYTKFEYDDLGRLIRTSKELLNYDFGDGKESFRPDQILNETIYNHGNK